MPRDNCCKCKKSKKEKCKEDTRFELDSVDLQLEVLAKLSAAQITTTPTPDTDAKGKLWLKFAPDFSSVEYRLTVRGLGEDSITSASLNQGAAGATGSVVAELVPSAEADNFDGCKIGTLTRTDLVGPLDPLAGGTIAQLYALARDGQLYVNVTSDDFPNGVVRGQVYLA